MSKREPIARTKVLWEGVLKTQAIIRGMEVHTDKPKSHHGTNTAPAPLEVFIASMGSCFMTTFLNAAMRSRIEVEDCSVDVKIYSGMVEDKERVTDAELKLKVWVKEEWARDPAKLEKCFEHAKENCSITNAVNFPIEISLSVKKE